VVTPPPQTILSFGVLVGSSFSVYNLIGFRSSAVCYVCGRRSADDLHLSAFRT
jgi:hypothetical protein